VIFCDRIMALGFYHAFKAGIRSARTTWWCRLEVDHRRDHAPARQGIRAAIHDGLITQGEKYNKVVDAWSKSTDAIADAMMKKSLPPRRTPRGDMQVNSIYRWRISAPAARRRRCVSIAGMRGLMAKRRRDHREPDHLELQGRPVGARVLQLDPRRP